MEIILKEEFLENTIKELKAQYFPNVIHGTTENPKYYKSVYYLECFKNGCYTYDNLIKQLSKKTRGRLKDLMKIIDNSIVNTEIL